MQILPKLSPLLAVGFVTTTLLIVLIVIVICRIRSRVSKQEGEKGRKKKKRKSKSMNGDGKTITAEVGYLDGDEEDGVAIIGDRSLIRHANCNHGSGTTTGTATNTSTNSSSTTKTTATDRSLGRQPLSQQSNWFEISKCPDLIPVEEMEIGAGNGI